MVENWDYVIPRMIMKTMKNLCQKKKNASQRMDGGGRG